MNSFEQYQQDALRTSKDTNARVYNCIHMVLGITSEYLETLEAKEITEKFQGSIEDHIKLTEDLKKEVGDILWYVTGLAHYQKLDFSRGEQGFRKMTINKAIETLNSVYKANWIYGRHMMDVDKTGIVLVEQVQDAIYNIIMWIEMTFPFKLQDVMDTNIAKLKARYPEKFEAELANNRLDQ